MQSPQRYKAFISYSHADRKAAEWIHRALETYRAPRALSPGADPSRLRPIFRDRDELSASADLSAAIRDALDRSDALILLCSPASAASRWVDQEVAHFLAARGLGQVICLIAPSTPDGTALTEILPPALRAALPEGAEPLAVDPRREADGRRLARLKIAARLLGVSLDQLVQRDTRRRLRVMAAFTSLAVAVAVGMGAMTVATLKSRQIAREQRDETEALVAYMLGDLREQLEPVGRLDLLDGVSAKVLSYYAKARTDQLDDKALAQRAKAQTLLGTIREQRGDLAGAEDAFGQAAATTHALVERDPRNGERIFDEAQNVFWLAYMEWRRGDVANAERGFKHYDALARELVRLDPDRPEWRIEVAYAQNNLGTLLFEQGRRAEALTAFRAALVVFDAERQRAPKVKARVVDTANTRAWVADCLLGLGRPAEALVERRQATQMMVDTLAANPGDKRLAAKTVATEMAHARLLLDVGKVAEARARSSEGRDRLLDLAALDPTNVHWREYLVVAQLDGVDLAIWGGSPAEARRAHAAAQSSLARLRTGETAKAWSGYLEGRLQQQAILLARQDGDVNRARGLAEALLVRLSETGGSSEKPIDRLPLTGFAQLAAGRPQQTIATLSPRRQTLPPSALDVLARAYLANGRRGEAEALVRELKQNGYAHPSFVAFWRDSPVGGIFNHGA